MSLSRAKNIFMPANINSIVILTSFARSVRESIAFGFYRTDLAPSSLGLYENLRQYFPVQTSHSVNKSLILEVAVVYSHPPYMSYSPI